MATSRLISFSSPVRPHLSKEETPDPGTGFPDEEILFEKDKDVPGESPSAHVPVIIPEEKTQSVKDVNNGRKEEHDPNSRLNTCTEPNKPVRRTVLPLVWCLSVTCLVVTVATTVSHILLDSVTAAAIILGITCPIIGWGVLSLILGKFTLICTYGFLLVFEIIALIVAGGLEAKELKWQMDFTNDISANLPTLPPVAGPHMQAEARRRTKILAAFTGLYFLCALVFIVTATSAFQFSGEVSERRSLRLHCKGKQHAEQAEKAETVKGQKKKEGAVRVPEHRAPSPDLLDEEELLDVDMTNGDAESPEALGMAKQAQMV